MSDELIGSYLACASCGERDIVRDAWLIYDQAKQDWIIHSIFDQYYCQQCEGTDTITKVDEAYRLEIIKDLNQKLRQGEVRHGTVILTKGIEALGAEFQYQLFQAIYDYDDFSKDNDPYNEQDFGSLTLSGHKIFWKIDYYDRHLEAHSRDKANPEVTNRVLTIMLAEEY